MESKVKQNPATNANPVLSVDRNGCVLYSSEAGNPLLNEWGVRVGEKLPSIIVDLVQKVIYGNSPEKMEVKVGKKVYLVVFHFLPENECVNIYGFDISCQKELEEKLYKYNRIYHLLFENMLDGFAYCRMLYSCIHVEELLEIMSILQYISSYLKIKIKIEYSVLSIIYFLKIKNKLCETPIHASSVKLGIVINCLHFHNSFHKFKHIVDWGRVSISCKRPKLRNGEKIKSDIINKYI